jgi:drug/metabolite transporter superfamily protein YnfA
MLSISVMLLVFGVLSRRLGRVTRAHAYYIGFFVASALVFVGAIVRIVFPSHHDLTPGVLWILLYNGAPALGLTIAVVIAWHYWSWLLAERG